MAASESGRPTFGTNSENKVSEGWEGLGQRVPLGKEHTELGCCDQLTGRDRRGLVDEARLKSIQGFRHGKELAHAVLACSEPRLTSERSSAMKASAVA